MDNTAVYRRITIRLMFVFAVRRSVIRSLLYLFQIDNARTLAYKIHFH